MKTPKPIPNQSTHNLRNGWREVKLGEICSFKAGNVFKREFQGRCSGEFPFIKVSDLNLSGNEISISGANNWVSKEEADSKYTIHPVGSVVFAKIGIALTYNRRRKIIRPTIIDNNMMTAIAKRINPNWLYYLLCTSDFNTISCGSALPYLTVKDLSQIPILLPPLPEQKDIAEILSSLDDKIDLLHRQNKTLENIAQTLFRQWFIEEADADWEEAKLGDIIDIFSGKNLKKQEHNPTGKYPVLGANGEIGRTDNYLLDEKIIFTGRVGTLGNVFISDTKVWLSDNTLIIKPMGNLFYYVYYSLKNTNLNNLNAGSTQPLIRQSDLKNIELLLPEKNILRSFEQKMNILFMKTKHNESQIATLENLRDTLLPKLMSGEVRLQTSKRGY